MSESFSGKIQKLEYDEEKYNGFFKIVINGDTYSSFGVDKEEAEVFSVGDVVAGEFYRKEKNGSTFFNLVNDEHGLRLKLKNSDKESESASNNLKTLNYKRVRVTCLTLACELMSDRSISNYVGSDVLDLAKGFEKYVLGEEQ